MKIDIEALKKWLLSLKLEDIEQQDNGNYALKRGYAAGLVADIDALAALAGIYKQRPLFQVGDYFLTDALGDDISLCVYTRRKYKLPTGRSIQAKLVCTLVEDCRETYGSAPYGDWLVPNEFLR